MTQISIRTIEEKDWELYKAIRLNSLLDSPDSFSATYSKESAYSDEDWQRRLSSNGKAAYAYPLVAFAGASAVGLAWGVVHKESDNHANVYQMWVSSQYRGNGIGRSLLKQIIFWSREQKRSCIHLGATTTNIAAIQLYESVGFQTVGGIIPLRQDSKLNVQNMVMDLNLTCA